MEPNPTVSNTSKDIVKLDSIVKIFKVKTQDVLVLKKVSTEIKRGDFVIVFGPSGCGKSTLLHVILGLEEPTAGNANVLNYDIYKMSEDGRSQFRKNHIGMVYQQANWIKSLSVIENVAFSPALLGISKEECLQRAQKALEMVGMQDWAHYYPTELSSGQQQRVSFARAIVTNPLMIIADEPTGNLDYQSGIEVMNLFKRFQEQGKTVIMVTHDVDNIDYASKVIQMFDGNIVAVHTVTTENAADIKKKLITKKTVSEEISNQNGDNDLIHQYGDESKVKEPTREQKWFKPLSINNLHGTIRNFIPSMKRFIVQTKEILSFLGLLSIYLLNKFIVHLSSKKLLPQIITDKIGSPASRLYKRLFNLFEVNHLNSISKTQLIDLSLKNMNQRRARSAITIGGMAIGIATIVFLVSLGYGLEKLVISRVARLEEMRQIDANPAIASNVKITDKTIADIKNMNNVEKVLPVIGVVGKVNFNNSNTDVAVYGVMADYLKESAIQPSEGEIFTSNQIARSIPSHTSGTVVAGIDIDEVARGQVAGVSTVANEKAKYLEKIRSVTYKIHPGRFVRVRAEPNTTGEILGYTRRVEGISEGSEVWGSSYTDSPAGSAGSAPSGEKLGKWIQSEVLLWELTTCNSEENSECVENRYIPLKERDGHQESQMGYFAEIGVEIDNDEKGAVLGITTEATGSATAVTLVSSESSEESTDEADLLIQELTKDLTEENTKKVDLPKDQPRVAVVNKSFLDVLGVSKGIGTKFNLTFIVTGALVNNRSRVESESVEYEIIGVTSDNKTPIIYVPLLDVKQLGLDNYSQMKVLVNNQNEVASTRKQIEVLGLTTSSVVDTVNQIEQFFSTVRLILGLLGVVALSVAALGMFNTLTISLLERTHEVGMMKAIGMKSEEVKDLFLTESMTMGVFGGIGGLLAGYLIGKILSILISSVAIIKGVGFLDISYIPPSFIALIIILSVIVGIITGVYPARRATKISALDALRYE